jgi:outer membrane protein TolC
VRTTAAALLLGVWLALLAGCQHTPRRLHGELERYCDAAAAAEFEPSLPSPVVPASYPSAVPLADASQGAGPDAHAGASSDLVQVSVAVPAEPGEQDPAAALALSDVIQAVYESYPLLEAALREREIAAGKELAAWGEFDTGLKASSQADALGYYKRYRTALKLDQPLPGGGSLYGGYKLGRGSFSSAWYDQQTNRGGEFSLGIAVPLLKDRLIDKRRSGVSQAALARQAVEPAVQAQLLEFVREGSQAYWYWVATGQALQANQRLLQLAQDRVQQIEQRVDSGDLERIARIDNQRLIALRQTKVIEAERKLQLAAIKLSLFLRTPDGQPLLPDAELLPQRFPAAAPPEIERMQRDIQTALGSRPELVELDLLLRKENVELAQAENLLRPKLDALLEASQDVGDAVFEKDSKGPFQLEAGVYGEVPLQRREARGKIAAARGKIAQLRAKREFVADKIVAEVQDALSALEAAYAKIEQAGTNLDLGRQALSLGREAFDAGDIDLIVLNIYEQAVADAGLAWIEAQAEYFAATANYQAALARDPLVTDPAPPPP